MSVLMEPQLSVRSRKRAAAKTTERKSVEKVKVTLVLSAEMSQRLSVHAAMVGDDRSALVDALIRDHLKRFVVADRAKPSDPATEVVSAV